jgi:GTP-binding protein YchF
MKVGLIGLSQSGKTTIFNAITRSEVATGSYQSKGEVHLGRVLVPDERLDWVTELNKSRKKVQTEVEYVDVAGLSGEKSKGIEEEIPPALRECDALAHVVRAFEDSALPHPKGSVDIRRDIRLAEEQLIFADLMIIENRLNKVSRKAKLVKDDAIRAEAAILHKVKDLLEDDQPLRGADFTPEERKLIRGYQFLSAKPMLLLLNVGEDDIPQMDALEAEHAALAVGDEMALVAICGKIQMELAQLDEEDRDTFIADLGLKGLALDRMIKLSYDLLGLISFLTTSDKESRAWTTRRGASAPEAAGVIHDDFQRGFIRAEVVSFDDLKRCGSEAQAKKEGLVRSEGKSYIVKDGDVIFFLFNV